tara:strand:+ start:2743 stop:3165 length:423 start_codon:yes stop_codon:yes gene_type:complete
MLADGGGADFRDAVVLRLLVGDGVGTASALLDVVFDVEDCFSADSVFAVEEADGVGGGAGTSSALLDVVFRLGVLDAVAPCGRLEGSSGFGSGGCALSDSVTASVAARSAAREVSEAFEGVMGCTLCEGADTRQLLHHPP